MTYTIDLLVDTVELTSKRIQVQGFDPQKRGNSIVTLPEGMDAPKLGQVLTLTFEVKP